MNYLARLRLHPICPTKAPAYKTPIVAPPYNWSGFYVGANFGGAWTNGSLNIPDNNFYGGITEFIGGRQGLAPKGNFAS